MEGPPYARLLKMGEDRFKYVGEQKQGEPTPIPYLEGQFAENNVVELLGTQGKKTIRLATYRQPSDGAARGVMVLLHTIGMHTGLAAHLALRLGKEGFVTVGFDQRGHGRSEGERGYLDDAGEVLRDTGNFFDRVFQMYPELPVFCFAIGSGALVLLSLLTKKKLKLAGIIMASPTIKRPSESKVLNAISGFALKLMPNRTGLFAFQFANQTRNPLASQKLKEDALVYHDKVFVGSLMQMQDLMDDLEGNKVEKIPLPSVAVIQGELDRVADCVFVGQLVDRLKSGDKQLWYYPKMWNMVLYEPEYPEIQEKIVGWLHAHAK